MAAEESAAIQTTKTTPNTFPVIVTIFWRKERSSFWQQAKSMVIYIHIIIFSDAGANFLQFSSFNQNFGMKKPPSKHSAMRRVYFVIRDKHNQSLAFICHYFISAYIYDFLFNKRRIRLKITNKLKSLSYMTSYRTYRTIYKSSLEL